jgi:hypothetical protein
MARAAELASIAPDKLTPAQARELDALVNVVPDSLRVPDFTPAPGGTSTFHDVMTKAVREELQFDAQHPQTRTRQDLATIRMTALHPTRASVEARATELLRADPTTLRPNQLLELNALLHYVPNHLPPINGPQNSKDLGEALLGIAGGSESWATGMPRTLQRLTTARLDRTLASRDAALDHARSLLQRDVRNMSPNDLLELNALRRYVRDDLRLPEIREVGGEGPTLTSLILQDVGAGELKIGPRGMQGIENLRVALTIGSREAAVERARDLLTTMQHEPLAEPELRELNALLHFLPGDLAIPAAPKAEQARRTFEQQLVEVVQEQYRQEAPNVLANAALALDHLPQPKSDVESMLRSVASGAAIEPTAFARLARDAAAWNVDLSAAIPDVERRASLLAQALRAPGTDVATLTPAATEAVIAANGAGHEATMRILMADARHDATWSRQPTAVADAARRLADALDGRSGTAIAGILDARPGAVGARTFLRDAASELDAALGEASQAGEARVEAREHFPLAIERLEASSRALGRAAALLQGTPEAAVVGDLDATMKTMDVEARRMQQVLDRYSEWSFPHLAELGRVRSSLKRAADALDLLAISGGDATVPGAI